MTLPVSVIIVRKLAQSRGGSQTLELDPITSHGQGREAGEPRALRWCLWLAQECGGRAKHTGYQSHSFQGPSMPNCV